MLDIQSKTSYCIQDNKLISKLSASTFKETSQITEWDLNQLVQVVTGFSLNEDFHAKMLQQKQEASSSTVSGALIGGAVGAAFGSGSVFKGAVLGGMLGAATSPEPIKFHDSKAKVGLIFADSTYLTVEVNPDEYTLLATLATSNQYKQVNPDKAAKLTRTLTPEESQQFKPVSSRYRAAMMFSYAIIFFVIANVLKQFANDEKWSAAWDGWDRIYYIEAITGGQSIYDCSKVVWFDGKDNA